MIAPGSSASEAAAAAAMALNRLYPRDLPSSPPAYRTRIQDNPTLIITWWSTGCSLAIILIRLWGRLSRSSFLFREDKIMALAILPLLARMALIHPVLLWGTNNIQTDGLSDIQLEHASMGARLVLASRIMYALYIWTAKFTISEFLKRMTSDFGAWTRKYEIILGFIRGTLVATFLAVFIATLAECQPFSHYWQVVPDPGPSCRTGYSQLITMGVCDIITDILLIGFPIPIVIRSSMSFGRKILLCILFSFSGLLIAIVAVKVPTIVHYHGSQQRRTLWASIEIMAASAVANALILGSFLRDKGVKKNKYQANTRTGSVDQPSINRTLTRQHWGNDSDENLFKTIGGRLNSCTNSESTQNFPRPAQKVMPLNEMALRQNDGPSKFAWFSNNQDLRLMSDASSTSTASPTTERKPRLAELLTTQQDQSFFDVGTDVENQNSPLQRLPPTPAPSSSDATRAFDFAPSSRRASTASGMSRGPGIAVRPEMVSPTRATRRRPNENGAVPELSPIRGDELELQDPGGLLS